MRPGQGGQGHVQKAPFIAVDQSHVLNRRGEVLTSDDQRRADAGGLAFDHLKRLIPLRADNAGDALFQNARLFERDLAQRVAEILLMVDRNGRDHRQRGFRDDVRRIDTTAEANLQQCVIRLHPRESQKRRRRGDLEERDLVAFVHLFAFFEQSRQRVFFDQITG